MTTMAEIRESPAPYRMSDADIRRRLEFIGFAEEEA